MKFKIFNIYILPFLLAACSPTYTLESYNNESIIVEAKIDSSILKIINPYQKEIEDQMSQVLSYTKHSLYKGKPQSTIGNFVTDLCLNYTNAHLCVMNNGGLRTNIEKGNITRGKIYELMPFENELVVLELDKNEYIELLNYIGYRGGEPFSGINLIIDNNGKIIQNSWPIDFKNGEKIKILTSDYLANGGDNMIFLRVKNK